MRNAESLSREQIREFLKSSEPIEFAGCGRDEKYAWVERVLKAQNYGDLSKRERGVVRSYLEKVTGMSVSQMTRLIRAFLDRGVVRAAEYRRHRFATRYTAQDISLLAEVDRAHERMSGPATRHILQREYELYGDKRYQRLAKISVAHLYNLRATARYRNQAAALEATRPTAAAIGERRRPDPQGRPGFLRVDTVHQGDWDGAKGVYHINAVDAVTQWQVVGCASKISEAYLLPVLKAVLAQFPFVILGFHADNGSEYINHRVAEMLEKLRTEFTKSRACRSQDNALVEGKNGSVIRKLIGYGHIASEHAEAIGKFYTAHLNPYLNFHRPCGFATVRLDERGKRRRQYKIEDYQTPLEKLKSLERVEQYLKPGTGLPDLEREAMARSDTACARQVSAAKARLLQSPVSAAAEASITVGEGCGNDGPVEGMEKQKQLSHAYHRPLEISQEARDFHIPTARLRGHGKVENQKQVSHFPTAARDDDSCSFTEKTQKLKKGSRPLRGLLIPYPVLPPVERDGFHAHRSIRKC
jgi:transposase InsO family protein